MTSPWARGPVKEIEAQAQYEFQALELADALEKITGGNGERAVQLTVDLFQAMLETFPGTDKDICEFMSAVLHGVLDRRNGRKPGALF